MRIRFGWACLVLLAAFAILGNGLFKAGAAQPTSPWLVSAAPSLRKITDLPGNRAPDGSNIDCATDMQQTPSGLQPICTFLSPLGRLGEGKIQIGQNQYEQLMGPTYSSMFWPSANPTFALLAMGSPGTGNYLGIYRNLSRSMLTHHKLSEQGAPYYDISQWPDQILRNPLTQAQLAIDLGSIAYSANGEWMAADLPQRGLIRVHLTDFSVKLFAGPIEPSWYAGVAGPPMAISNDGRYVASTSNIFSTKNLSIYDTETCDDQLNVSTNQHYCSGKEIFSGHTATGLQLGAGLLAAQQDLQRPVHLRFINDDNVSFYARYQAVSSTVYSVANFVATAPGGVLHKLGLLGMGDSYISGQGEFSYREGTDTAINPCHLSSESYPLLLGAQYFNSYNSVACSGAVTGDIGGSDKSYHGQVKDDIKEKDRSIQPILATFSPGYIYQQDFASAYTPEAVLLSVGGDDIGFADIVKRCVANIGGSNCYSSYEDRLELMSEINSTYPKLVTTYQTIRQQSGGARLYVVGYPQIVKPDGDCGDNVHLSASETEFAAQIVHYLDGIVSRAAATAGVAYIDTEHSFDGHRLCEAGQKAVNGLTAGNDGGVVIFGKTVNVIGSESYHPTVYGHQLLAETVRSATGGLSTAMPAPQPYSIPTIDQADPLLQAVEKTGRPLNTVTYNAALSDDTVVNGQTLPVTAFATDVPLQPNASYQIVLHSNPVQLATGTADANGNIRANATIPADVPPGFHVLHVYTTDMAGNNLDIQKTIYIATETTTPAVIADVGADNPPAADVPQVVVKASIAPQVPSTSQGAQISPETTPSVVSFVLGSNTPAPDRLGVAATTVKPVQHVALYRLNWVMAAGAFLVLAAAVTMANYALKRR